ncbi:Acyl-CoA synthetase (NDP forming) [Balamuthia mandrillaris]
MSGAEQEPETEHSSGDEHEDRGHPLAKRLSHRGGGGGRGRGSSCGRRTSPPPRPSRSSSLSQHASPPPPSSSRHSAAPAPSPPSPSPGAAPAPAPAPSSSLATGENTFDSLLRKRLGLPTGEQPKAVPSPSEGEEQGDEEEEPQACLEYTAENARSDVCRNCGLKLIAHLMDAEEEDEEEDDEEDYCTEYGDYDD